MRVGVTEVQNTRKVTSGERCSLRPEDGEATSGEQL